MAGSNKPLPKTQSQISQDSINPFQGGPASGSKQPIQDLKKRELQRSVKDDNTKRFSLNRCIASEYPASELKNNVPITVGKVMIKLFKKNLPILPPSKTAA